MAQPNLSPLQTHLDFSCCKSDEKQSNTLKWFGVAFSGTGRSLEILTKLDLAVTGGLLPAGLSSRGCWGRMLRLIQPSCRHPSSLFQAACIALLC